MVVWNSIEEIEESDVSDEEETAIVESELPADYHLIEDEVSDVSDEEETAILGVERSTGCQRLTQYAA